MGKVKEEWQIRAEDLILAETSFRGPFHWSPLSGDGSERAFYRLIADTGTLVLLRGPGAPATFPNENDSYVYLGQHLRRQGIPVPRIYGYWRSEGLVLMEDLGAVHLQKAAGLAGEELEGLYRQATGLLLRMQVEATANLDTGYCFDTPVYDASFVIERELRYFHQSYLRGALGLEVGWSELEEDFNRLAREAAGGSGPSFFMHRDFQSRNLMVKDRRLYLIDFQGARLGPPQYDLAALLLDPYVQLPESLQRQLLAMHGKRLSESTGISAGEFLGRYPHVALCRNLQMLAAFAFLAGVRGRSRFVEYIMPAWQGLGRLLGQHPCRDYRLLAKLVESQSEQRIATAVARLRRQAGSRPAASRDCSCQKV